MDRTKDATTAEGPALETTLETLLEDTTASAEEVALETLLNSTLLDPEAGTAGFAPPNGA